MNETPINDTVAITEEGGVQPAKRRGRKPLENNFEFPEGEWRIRDVAAKYKVSVPYVHLKIKAAGADVEKVRVEKNPGGRGKPATIYAFVGKRQVKPEDSIS